MSDFTAPGQYAKLVTQQVDTASKLTFSVLRYENSGDYIAARGPASEEFFSRGNNTSYNTCNKPWGVLFKPEVDAPYEFWNKDPWEAPDYSGRHRYGPFLIVAHEPDTFYFCIQHQDKFKALEFEEILLHKDQIFQMEDYIGWNVAVFDGMVNERSRGALLPVSGGEPLVATEDSRVVLVRVAGDQ